MKLLDEIIDLATADKGSVATLLRRCLVLARELRNEKLKTWAEAELKGYGDDVEVPEYRITPASAKGILVGPGFAQIKDQPIHASALREKHRHFARTVELRQPIAVYEGCNNDSVMAYEWPADLTALYQRSLFGGGFVLNRAWQAVPGSVLSGLIDTIKTRVLSFALELKDELGATSDKPDEIPKGKVEQLVINNIYGGNVAIASRDVVQSTSIVIRKGDWPGLVDVLKQSGLQEESVAELRSALDQDARDQTAPSLGQRTLGWLKQFGKASGKLVVNIGSDVAKKWIEGYLGLNT